MKTTAAMGKLDSAVRFVKAAIVKHPDSVDLNRDSPSRAPGARNADGKKREPFSNDQRVGR
jgi:hypothetical protein